MGKIAEGCGSWSVCRVEPLVSGFAAISAVRHLVLKCLVDNGSRYEALLLQSVRTDLGKSDMILIGMNRRRVGRSKSKCSLLILVDVDVNVYIGLLMLF